MSFVSFASFDTFESRRERQEKNKRTTTKTIMSCEDEDLEALGVKSGAVLFSNKTKYVIIKLLGEGGFGAVFLVQDMVSRERERPAFALKVEKKLDNRRHSKLKMEIAILKAVNSVKQGEEKKDKHNERLLRHFTEIIDRAKKDRYFFLVMQLVGKSLADLKYERRERVLSLGTGLSVSHQCLEAVQCLHDVGYLHRDLKPANYACGLKDKAHNIYLLDFGIARMFKKRNEKSGAMEIKTPRDSVLFKGTVRFASLACHRNVEMGPKDDCESWFYLLLDLLVPKGLPWRKETDKVIVQKIKESCRKNPEMLFNKIKCEEDLTKIFTYLNNLEYTDTVDYEYVYQLLEEAGKNCQVDLSAPYEWEGQHNNTTTALPTTPIVAAAGGQESIKK